MNAESAGHVDILLVEDNRGDVRLIREALKAANVRYDLSVASDGEAAMHFLRREEPYAEAVRPDIVILDLNLPKKSGFSVLEEVKGDPSLKRIPVIILTTSSYEEDIAKSYDRHANCFITKPIDMREFINIVNQIKQHWFATVQLPPH